MGKARCRPRVIESEINCSKTFLDPWRENYVPRYMSRVDSSTAFHIEAAYADILVHNFKEVNIKSKRNVESP
jgi:hypothetical protein